MPQSLDDGNLPWLVGDSAVLHNSAQTSRLARVVRATNDGLMFARVPMPSETPFCSGCFGLCYRLQPGDKLTRCDTATEPGGLRSDVAVWSGEGHFQGRVVACRGTESLIQFRVHQAPQWHCNEELQLLDAVTGADEFQCSFCLAWSA